MSGTWCSTVFPRFGTVPVTPPPGAFLQATKAGETALTEVVMAGVGGAKRVADLFAGSGTFTFPLAHGGATVAAFDDNARLVQAAHQQVQHGARLGTDGNQEFVAARNARGAQLRHHLRQVNAHQNSQSLQSAVFLLDAESNCLLVNLDG